MATEKRIVEERINSLISEIDRLRNIHYNMESASSYELLCADQFKLLVDTLGAGIVRDFNLAIDELLATIEERENQLVFFSEQIKEH